MFRGNPKNDENVLYRALTRIFSGPITKKRRQFARRENRRDLQKHQFKSASGQPFKKYSKDMFNTLSAKMVSEQQRAERYGDFDMMMYTPEIASALDIYADEITTSNSFQDLLQIECKNQEIKSILHELYYNVLNAEMNLFFWTKTMCKYGDFFLYLDIDEKMGVTNVIGLPGREVERMEGLDPKNPNYIQYQWNSAGMTFENWQIAHFRILGDDKFAPYGTSILEPARRIWRQLTLLEDAMMAYRIVRSPERRVFYLDVGNIPPDDVKQYVLDFQTELKKNQIVDSNTGRVDLRYNALSVEEDYVIPVRGQTQTKIDTLQGGQYTGDIEDVRYLQEKMLSALKIPSAYLLSGEGGMEDKTTLAQKDVRFSRTIQRIQKAVIAEMEKIGTIHLYTLGFRGDDLLNFSLALANPSKIAELQELEHWRTKFDVASAATEGFFSKRHVATKFFGLNEEEFIRNQREIFNDKKFEVALEQIMQMGEMEGGEGLFGPEGAGSIGGGFGNEDMDIAPMGDEMGAEGGMEDEIDDTLLAQPSEPGKRDDGSRKVKIKKRALGKDAHTTVGAKGKFYTPVNKRSKRGDRKRHLDGLWNKESSRNTPRNVTGGRDLLGLGSGITESEDFEERQIQTINESLQNLVEKKNND